MSKGKNQTRKLIALGCTGAVAGITLLAGCGNGGGEARTGIAVMPGADVVVSANMDELRESKMYDRLQEMSEENQELKKNNQNVAKLDALGKQLKEITGLESGDFSSFQIAMDLDTVDVAQDDQLSTVGNGNVAFAVSLKKDLSLDKLEEALRKTAEQGDNAGDVEFGREQYKGIPVLTALDTSNAEAAKLYLAMIQDNRLLAGGTEVGLKQALDRAASGKALAVADVFDKTLVEQLQAVPVTIILAPTDNMKAALKAKAVETAQNKPGSVQANAAQAVQSVEGLALNIGMQDTMTFALTGIMGSEKDAEQLKTIIDNSVINSVQFILAMMTGGKPLPLTESMQTQATPDGLVQLSFVLSPEDLDILKQLAEQQGAQPGRNLPGGMPSAPGGQMPMPMPQPQ